jgi:predicted transcriptional regulator
MESYIDDLFMELAGETRRSMIQILAKNDEKLSKIAETLSISIQDAHRNSSRLVKCGLINKNSDNLFFLTSLGLTIAQQLDSFEFLSKHNQFFQTHTMGDLDPKFIRRIGDLANSRYVAGMGPVLETLKRIAKESDKIINIITTQYPLDTARVVVEKANQNISIRYIFDHFTTVPQKEREELLKNTSWRMHISNGIVKRKMVKKLHVCLTATEKEAIVFFPDLKGNNDMVSGFFSSDPVFLDWCADYFDHIWSHADSFDDSKLIKT